MRVAMKAGAKVWMEEVGRRPLEPHEIRVKVLASGVCGTDLHVNPDRMDPMGFGHEVAGEILEVGAAAPWLEPGRRIVLESGTACGRCDNCRNARQDLCRDVKGFLASRSFGMAPEMIAQAAAAIPCDDLRPDIACLSEPLGVAIDMVRLAEIGPRSNVLLIGPGPIGLMGVALARRQGARRVFVAARREQTARVAVAERFGADAIVDSHETPLAEHDFGCEIDRVLVTAPPPTLNDAFEVAARGAIVSFIGIDYGDAAFCRFDANAFHFKKLQLRASYASPALRTPLALDYLREGVVDGEALVTARMPLEPIEAVMETARDKVNHVKVVVTPNGPVA